MSKVLYRKYRSQTFNELIGQDHITAILKNAVKNESIAHAYLFVGARGTGKTSAARILAKSINCLSPNADGNPDNECEVCRGVVSGNFIDMIEIDAASNRGIDQIRELKERIEFTPSEGKYKVYIIDEVHMLTKEAFNALLKTLEEPPEHVVFILATTDVHKLPPTILSRCQRYDFKLGTDKQIAEIIKKTAKSESVKLSSGALKLLVENAHGSYRDSLSLLDVVFSGQIDSDKPDEISEGEVRTILGVPDTTMVYYLLEKLVKSDNLAALELISELDSKGVDLQQFVKYVLKMLREILVQIIKGTVDPNEFSFAKDLSDSDVIHLINLFLRAEKELKNASIPSLILEMIIPSVNLSVSPKEGTSKGSPSSPKSAIVKDLEGKDSQITSEKKQKVEKKVVKKKNELTNNTENKVNNSESKVNDSKSDEKKLKKAEISLEGIQKVWKDVTNAIKPANGHLFAFLESAKLISFGDGVLKIEVPFSFHKDRIDEVKSKEAIRDVFLEKLGGKVEIECTVNTSIKKRQKISADVILKKTPESNAVAKKEESNAKVFRTKPGDKGLSKEVEAIFEDM